MSGCLRIEVEGLADLFGQVRVEREETEDLAASVKAGSLLSCTDAYRVVGERRSTIS